MAKQGAGRPTKFSDQLVNVVAHLAKEGKTKKEMADIIGVARSTFFLWIDSHEELSDALKDAESVANDMVELSLFRKACGFSYQETKLIPTDDGVIEKEVQRQHPPDTVAAIFWLKNRRPDRWRDRIDDMDADEEKYARPDSMRRDT